MTLLRIGGLRKKEEDRDRIGAVKDLFATGHFCKKTQNKNMLYLPFTALL